MCLDTCADVCVSEFVLWCVIVPAHLLLVLKVFGGPLVRATWESVCTLPGRGELMVGHCLFCSFVHKPGKPIHLV